SSESQDYVVDAVLRKGFKVTEKDKHGASVLHYAAGTRSVKLLKLLLKRCGDASVNEEDNFGSTPLHYAAFSNRTKTTQLLLEMGCKKDKKDHKGRTAADLAQMMGYGDIVQLL
ncbi:hypothetical protein CAPTEDRAFT_59796, partial [Capitella teleta]